MTALSETSLCEGVRSAILDDSTRKPALNDLPSIATLADRAVPEVGAAVGSSHSSFSPSSFSSSSFSSSSSSSPSFAAPPAASAPDSPFIFAGFALVAFGRRLSAESNLELINGLAALGVRRPSNGFFSKAATLAHSMLAFKKSAYGGDKADGGAQLVGTLLRMVATIQAKNAERAAGDDPIIRSDSADQEFAPFTPVPPEETKSPVRAPTVEGAKSGGAALGATPSAMPDRSIVSGPQASSPCAGGGDDADNRPRARLRSSSDVGM